MDILTQVLLALFYLVLPTGILIVSLTSNILGIAVLLRKRMKYIHMGPRNMYIYMFVMDSIIELQILVVILACFNFNIPTMSDLACKLYRYFNYVTNCITQMMLVYISVDRIVSIRFPAKRHILRSKRNQIAYIFVLVLFNMVYFIPVPFFYEVQVYSDFLATRQIYNQTNNYNFFNPAFMLVCEPNSRNSHIMLSSMVFINRTLISSVILIITTISLVISIFKIRERIRNNKTLKKDIKFSITAVFLNVFYLMLVCPIFFLFLKEDYYPYINLIIFFSYLLFLSYGINFYIFYFTNSLFRREFYNMIKRQNNVKFKLNFKLLNRRK